MAAFFTHPTSNPMIVIIFPDAYFLGSRMGPGSHINPGIFRARLIISHCVPAI
jgi:hypothetical protein